MKRLISLLSLIICACLLLASCGNKENPGTQNPGEISTEAGSDDASANPLVYTAVAEASFPKATSTTMAKADVEALYRPYTDWRIYQIRTTETTVKPAEGGQAYYISNNGNDAADGKTPETAIKTLSNIAKLSLKAGDVVYFERGGIWRGDITASVEGVSYSAYGEGRKPEIYASPENAAKPECWEATDAPNVWKYYTKSGRDIGTITFNQGEGIGKKIIVENGRDATTRKEFKDYTYLEGNFSFYHARTGEIYVYYDGGNPGEVFNSIELSVKEHIFKVRANNITIDNLCFKYGGAHGVSSGDADGLTVTNCEFAFIGGSIQNTETNVRYGNGVEIWGYAKNFTVDNCYFWQMYDTGATFQYRTTGDTDYSYCENIKFNNNVFEYCNYSIEYFLSSGSEDVSYIKDFEIKNNLCWYVGQGLCEQRPDKKESAHIKSWGGHDNYIKGNFEISNNLFAYAANVLVETRSKNGVPAVYNNNVFVQTDKGKVGSNGSIVGERISADEVLKITGDTNATVIISPRESN